MKTLTPLVRAGLFRCFHNPPNWDMDYRIFNRVCDPFACVCVYTRGTSVYSLIQRTFSYNLHFWQNDRDLLRATMVIWGRNGYRNKSQHRKLTLEKENYPAVPAWIRTWDISITSSNRWAIPAPRWVTLLSPIYTISLEIIKKTSESRAFSVKQRGRSECRREETCFQFCLKGNEWRRMPYIIFRSLRSSPFDRLLRGLNGGCHSG